MSNVPTNLIPTRTTELPEYTGVSQAGYLPYVIDGRSYKVQFSQIATTSQVPPTREINTGVGLAGGGDLTQNRTIYIVNQGVGYNQLDKTGVVAGTYGTALNVPVISVDDTGRVTGVTTTAINLPQYVPTTRTVTAGAGLSGGGDLSANRTFSINFSSATPQPLGVASAGTGTQAAREDHVHPAVDLSDTTETQGVLPLVRGGTGNALSPVVGAVIYTSGSGLSQTTTGGAGQVLVSAGGAGAPYWQTVTGIGTVTSVNVSGGTTGLSFSGGPITAAGTITMAGTLGVANGGTGTTTAFTAGSVVFADASGVYSQSNSQLFWDNANTRLGIGTASPTDKLTVNGTITGYNGSDIFKIFSGSGISYAGTTSSTVLAFITGGAERGRFSTSGNFGIGTNSPATRLAVAGSSTLGTTIGDVAITTDQMGYEYATDTLPAILPTLNLDFINANVVDPRITFTRSTTGTYYDGKTTALAEQNLFTYSQEFDNAVWTKTAVTVTANTTAAPDSTTTADTVAETATTASHYFQHQSIPVISGLPYTTSIYVKKGTGASSRDFFQIAYNTGAFSATAYANFDIVAGTVTATGAGTTATITSVGSGWFRCSMTYTASSSTNGIAYLAPVNSGTAGGLPSFAGSVDATVFIWGAQFETRSTATAYTVTTASPITNYIPQLLTAAINAPRLDFDPVTRAPRGLLIEEQRTNIALRSDDFSNASWIKTNSTVSGDTIVSPDGTVNADKLVDNTTSGSHQTIQNITTTAVATTFSVYAKAAERNWIALGIGDSTSNIRITYFNLSTGVVGTVGTNITASIQSVGNGWYRCIVTVSTAFAGTNPCRIYLCTGDGVNSYAGDGWAGAYIWGAQVEAGAFATSYIPTVASQVTRGADVAQMTGANFTNWYNLNAGTWLAEWSPYAVTGSVVAQISAATNNDRFQVQNTDASQIGITTGGVGQGGVDAGTVNAGASNKFAFAYQTNDVPASLNGGAVVADTSVIIPVVDRLCIGATVTPAGFLNGYIRHLTYYPTRLSNTILQGMTK